MLHPPSLWKNALALAAGLLCTAQAAAQCAGVVLEPGQPAAQVVALSGRGETRPAGAAPWQPAALSQTLGAGADMRTLALSSAALLLADRTQIRMAAQAQLRLCESRPARTLLELVGGRLWARTKKTPAALELQTPAALAVVRGTDWDVEVEEGGRTTLTVLSGRIAVSNALGAVDVGPSEQATVEPGQAPVKRLLVQWTVVDDLAFVEGPKDVEEVARIGREVKGPHTDVGMMFQRATLLEWRTAIENVLLPVEIQRTVTAADKARAAELLAMVGLKDFARLDRAMSEEVDLNECIRSALVIARNGIKDKAETILQLGELPRMPCAPSQINQVLLNLLNNAAQAIDGFGQILVKTWADDSAVCISVQDSGRGMPPEVLARIFDPFFTTKPVGQGTGLGLSISYKIIQDHGGQIRAASEPGRGTRFLIRLPRPQALPLQRSA